MSFRLKFIISTAFLLSIAGSLSAWIEITALQQVAAGNSGSIKAIYISIIVSGLASLAGIISFSFASNKKSLISNNDNGLTTEDYSADIAISYDKATEKNSRTEADWLKSINNTETLETLCGAFISKLCLEYSLAQGVVYIRDSATEVFSVKGSFAYYSENTSYTFKLGEGICGQVAKNKKSISLQDIPEGYIKVVSALGSATPSILYIYPVVASGETVAVIELASFIDSLPKGSSVEDLIQQQFGGALAQYL
jgi:putative methionine-R-sulfoxide reductase with GAF domain